jgi:hypothetical protein
VRNPVTGLKVLVNHTTETVTTRDPSLTKRSAIGERLGRSVAKDALGGPVPVLHVDSGPELRNCTNTHSPASRLRPTSEFGPPRGRIALRCGFGRQGSSPTSNGCVMR